MSTYTVDVPRALAGRYAGALASLPVTLGGGPRRIALVDGADPHWPSRAPELAGVVLAQPGTARLSVPALTVPVVVDLPWSGSPAGRVKDDDAGVDLTIVDVSFELGPADARTLRDAAHDLLVVVLRQLSSDALMQIDTWYETDEVLSASGSCAGAALIISGGRTAHSSGGGRVALRTAERTLDIAFPPPGASYPGSIRIVGPDGEQLLPWQHSDSHRTSLLELVALVESGCTGADLELFQRAAAKIESAQNEVTDERSATPGTLEAKQVRGRSFRPEDFRGLRD